MQTTEKSQESTIKDTTKMNSAGIATIVDQTGLLDEISHLLEESTVILARPTSVQKQPSTSTMIVPVTTPKILNVN